MSKFLFKQPDACRQHGLRVRLQLTAVVGLFALMIGLLVGTGTTPSAQAAQARLVTPSWAVPIQAITNCGYPTVSARSDGTVGLSGAGACGAVFAYHRPTDSGYKVVAFPSTSKSVYSTGIYDPAGNFHMAWQDFTDSGYHVFYSKIDSNGNVLINARDLNFNSQALSGISTSGLPSLTVRSDGRLYMALEETGFNVSVIESDDGGNTWINNRVLGTAGKGGVSNPHITVDSANGLHVVFVGNVGRDVMASDSDSNGNFGTLVFLDNQGTQGRAFFPGIATSPKTGDLFAVWQEDAPSAFGVGAVSLARWDSASKKWQPELRNITNSGSGTFSYGIPSVTVDGGGIVWVSFRANIGSTIKYSYTTSTDTTGSAFNTFGDIVGSANRSANAPTSMAYANGYVYFSAQYDATGTFGDWVSHSQANIGPPPPPPSNCNAVNQPIGTLGIPPQGAYTYNLPFLANNYAPAGQTATGCFTTFVALQNIGDVPASVTFNYYDRSGNSIQVPDGTCNNVPIPVAGECIAPNPLMQGNAGSAVVVSSQPLNVIVSEATPFGGSAYPVRAGANTNLVVPLAYNNTFGGFITQLTVFNPTITAASITVTFYDAAGTVQTNAVQQFTLPAFRANSLDQTLQTSKLPIGFNGWATISSTNGVQIVAQVLEQNPNNSFVAIANAQPQPTVPVEGTSATIFAPAIFNCAFNCYYTGASLVNPNPTATTVNLTYYNLAGTPLAVAPFTIGPNAIVNIYNGAPHSTTNTPGLPDGGMPDGYNGSATISSTMGLVMVVNEKFSGGSGTYAASKSGQNVVNLPVVANGGGNGFVTGFTILNTTNQTVGGTVQYYDVNGVPAGSVQNFSIGPNASQQYYQGSGGGSNLGAGFYGTAIITQTSGTGSNNLIVTTNAVSSSFFYTYTEPNQ